MELGRTIAAVFAPEPAEKLTPCIIPPPPDAIVNVNAPDVVSRAPVVRDAAVGGRVEALVHNHIIGVDPPKDMAVAAL
jgi:hypothetical protein